MLHRAAEGEVDRVAEGDLNRLVRLVGSVPRDGQGDIFRGVAGRVGQGAGSQGVVGSPGGGRPAGHGVIHGDGLAGFGVQIHCQQRRTGSLCALGRSGGEGSRRRIVIVIDGVGVGGDGAQGAAAGTAYGDQHRLRGFVQGVVGDGDGDVPGRVAGRVGQGARSQGVIRPAPGGRTTGHGVVHGHRLAGRRVEGHRQQRRCGRLVPV